MSRSLGDSIVHRSGVSADPEVLDYSKDIYVNTAKTGGGGHPLINSVLGNWIDHMKGDRKNVGHSLQKDLMKSRDEKYWNEI